MAFPCQGSSAGLQHPNPVPLPSGTLGLPVLWSSLQTRFYLYSTLPASSAIMSFPPTAQVIGFPFADNYGSVTSPHGLIPVLSNLLPPSLAPPASVNPFHSVPWNLCSEPQVAPFTELFLAVSFFRPFSVNALLPSPQKRTGILLAIWC